VLEKNRHNRQPKVYFASDFHLGIPDHDSSFVREKKLVSWLDNIRHDASEIYLMGDVFDFWFEYKTVVPKGYIRLLGKLAEMTDQGIPVHLFTGNHDVWAFDYLKKEINIQLHNRPEILEIMGRKFYLAHGDGLGPGDLGYKFLKRIFRCKLNQWLFRWLHPDIGTSIGLYFSRKSRLANVLKENRQTELKSIENEMLYQYAVKMMSEGISVDYFVFGHHHLPLVTGLDPKTQLVILGDWLTNFTFAEFDGNTLELKYF